MMCEIFIGLKNHVGKVSDTFSPLQTLGIIALDSGYSHKDGMNGQVCCFDEFA